MFSTVLKEITGSLDRRFLLTLFFPSLLFWGGLLVLFAMQGDSQALLASWNAQSTEMQWVQIAAAVAWVTFFAVFLSHQLTWLTKQFEGYWEWPLGDRLRQWRTRHYERVLRALDVNQDADYERIYYAYPLPNETDQLMPTRLGNILKNAELYPLQRYEADAVLLWPRLYAVLPDSFTAALGETKASMELMLVISALSGLFAVTAGLGLLIAGGPWWLFLACFLGGLALARLAYGSALQAAVPYAQLIKSAFDLYRGDLVDKLGYERPKSLEAETAFWDNLGKLIYRGGPEDASVLRYQGSKEEPAAPPEGAQDMPWLTLLKKLVDLWIGKRRSP
jgi:hypothetical protein